MWRTVTLDEVCTLRNGRAYKKPELLSEGKYPVLRVGNFFTSDNWYYSDLELEETKYCANGDLLYAWSASFGPRIWEGGKVIYHYHIWRVDVDETLVDRKFLFYWFEYDKELVKAASGTGTTMMHVSKGSMEKRVLQLPPLAEQQRIVEKLDGAFAEIDGAIELTNEQIQQNNKLFDAAVEARFEQKSGWVRKTLQDVCEKITDGTHQTPKYFEDGYIFLSSKNVTTRKIDWRNIKYIDEEQHLAMQKRLSPKVGDVLLAKNGTTGVAAMVDREVEFDIYVSLACLRSKGDVTPKFLLQFINSRAAKIQFSKRIKGIGVPNLHLNEIREVEINFPVDTSEQEELTMVIDEIDEQYQRRDASLRRKTENLYQLKSAILAQELQPPQSEAA